jgi:cell division septation protein DedD
MNLLPQKPTQIELFPKSGEQIFSSARQPFVIKDLTLSAENIIVLGIIFIVSMVVFFSIGVERGKFLAIESMPETVEIVKARNSDKPLSVQDSSAGSEGAVKPRSADGDADASSSEVTESEKREVLEIPIEEHFRYTIQVASFSSLRYAQKEAEQLEKRGHESFIMPKGKHQIVCVGRFSGKGEAKEYAHKIKDRYQDYLIRSR